MHVLLAAYSLFEGETDKKKSERRFVTSLGKCGSRAHVLARHARRARVPWRDVAGGVLP